MPQTPPAAAPAVTPVVTPVVTPAVTPAAGGVQSVRRVITYILLIIMVTTAAIGVSGLLGELFRTFQYPIGYGNFGLAQSLAFTFIAGPLALLLWWLTWREPANRRDRASAAWPVYLVIMATGALLTFTISLFNWLSDRVIGSTPLYQLALPIVWALVWVWYYWMWQHPSKGPTRMVGVAPAIASLIGLSFATGGTVLAISNLIDSATRSSASVVVGGDPVWQQVTQSLIWAIGGGLLWWWHWFRVGVRAQQTGFSKVLLIFVSGAASYALVAFGLSSTLSVVLSLITEPGAPLRIALEPLGLGLACAAVGALILVYHASIIRGHGPEVRSANRLVSAGVSLSFAATGIGMSVNALLASSTDTIIGRSSHGLLMSGISALLVGGVLWWVTWQPLQASTPERVVTPGRRVYLVVIFGVSALVALITLLVIGYQLFSFVLDGGGDGGFISRSRQAIGLLTATVFVAVYHFAIWNRDRASGLVAEPVRRIDRITLVASAADGALASSVHSATGARVSVLRRADALDTSSTIGASEQSGGNSDLARSDAVIAALTGVTAPHVLVLVGENSTVQVIPLLD